MVFVWKDAGATVDLEHSLVKSLVFGRSICVASLLSFPTAD